MSGSEGAGSRQRGLATRHFSMRVRHAEQALQGVYALEPVHQAGFDVVSDRLGRIRHLLWNGYHDEARRELFGVRHLASEAVYVNGKRPRAAVGRFLGRCDALSGYLANNETALIDYGSRHHAGLPVSTSRAEGCVDEIANARLAKRRRMRWSPHGAHRVAVVRAGVLDRRLTPERALSEVARTARVFSTPGIAARVAERSWRSTGLLTGALSSWTNSLGIFAHCCLQ